MSDKLELQKMLRMRMAAYACHEYARDDLANALRGKALSNGRLHFNAYFCAKPAVHLPRRGGALPPPTLVAPFIDREIARRTLSLAMGHDWSDTKCRNYLGEVRRAIAEFEAGVVFRMPLAYTDPSDIYSRWYRCAGLGAITAATMASELYAAWRTDPTSTSGRILSHDDADAMPMAMHRQECIRDIKMKLSSRILSPPEKMAYVNLFALLYYALMTTSNDDDCLYYAAAPLCTRRTFFGLLVATVEAPSGGQLNPHKVKDALEDIKQDLDKQAEETYLPALILSENSWEEDRFHAFLKGSAKRSRKKRRTMPVIAFAKSAHAVYSALAASIRCRDLPPNSRANDCLEQALIDLWRRRRRCNTTVMGLNTLRKSLVLRTKMVASPTLIGSVRHVAHLGITEPKKAPLPAVLVYAPAGSGKEMMSRLIPLLSKDFWNKPVRTENMGCLEHQPGQHGRSLRDLVGELVDSDFKDGGTLVLDELNSLDIRAQVDLLRILEEGDIGELSKKKDGCPRLLVVGLINEPPERLALGPLQERILGSGLLGDLISVPLYEYLKGKSRLRDDLYYRIRRSGEIRISGLDDRRPDIPIIFYFQLRNLVQEQHPGCEIFLEYGAVEALIDDGIHWKGNIRTLEAVARRLAPTLLLPLDDCPIMVTKRHIEGALIAEGLRRAAVWHTQHS